ncbi:hypothetical protein [Acanthopleuribacter pedis]|uniref:Uncharacterized protein n=1 Tax=Acanthopleuribacter pedis TaxID=442870 RepID=A0A8J7QP96_9BACT|nr:hypothetical protein [Acanthopleuribacter pedis]MBO1321610.1 hypothetical protein [Acanthopleuribacter pedis]
MRFIWVILLCPFFLAQNATEKIDAYNHGLKILDTEGIAKAQEFFLQCHQNTGDKMCYFGLVYTLFENYENHKTLKMIEIMKATGDHDDLYFGHLYNLEGQALNRTRNAVKLREKITD